MINQLHSVLACCCVGQSPCSKCNCTPGLSWTYMYTHSSLSPLEGGCASCCHSAIQEWTFCTERQELFINSAFQNKWSVLTCCAYLNNCTTCAVAASLTLELCLLANLHGFYSTIASLASPEWSAASWFRFLSRPSHSCWAKVCEPAYVWQQGGRAAFRKTPSDPRGVALNVKVRRRRSEREWETYSM